MVFSIKSIVKKLTATQEFAVSFFYFTPLYHYY